MLAIVVEEAGDEAQRLPGGKVGIEAGMLGQVAGPAPDFGALLDDIQPKDGAAPGRRFSQPQQQLNGRALASTVGAEKAGNRVARHGQRQILECLEAIVALAQPLGLNNYLCIHRVPPWLVKLWLVRLSASDWLTVCATSSAR